MLKKYIGSKVKTILGFFVFVAIVALVAELCDMPSNMIVYVCLLCGFFGLAFMLYDLYRYSQRIEELEQVKSRIIFGPEKMPKATDNIEDEYQQIIERLYDYTAEVISQKDSALTDMTDYFTMWAHQIKTPIAAMRLLLQSVDTGGDPEQESYRNEMNMQLFKIEEYVGMILQYLRLGGDSSDFILKEQDVDGIIKEAVKKYSKIFIKKKISLNYEPVNYSVVSDEKWLTFVIEQILSNALKYTREGSISVYMEANSPGTLVIEDTGIGIQPEDLPRIFDRGYTGYNGRTDKKSTGIGLYLCRQILVKLGHNISAESEVGKGTKIKIELY